MKKLMLLVFCLLILFQSAAYGNEPSYTNANGKAAAVMDVNTGRLLYGKNMHEQMPMASTTKIMTALLAIENMQLDHVVKIAPEAVGIEGSSIYLRANERVRMIDLLYGLMLRSGNDAAVAIAIEVGGSVEDFAKMMTQRAIELGATQTNFTNPHGLHHENHYTTAYDLALITRAALKEPLFKEISATKFWVAERDEYKYFSNKNKILGGCEGGDGVKIGFTKKAGRCLVASASRDGMQFIAVTLNDPNWFNEATRLLDDSFDYFRPYQPLEKDRAVKTVLVKDGKLDQLALLAARDVIIPLSNEEIPNLEMVIDTPTVIDAPIRKGDKIGTASFYLEDQLLSTTDLLAQEGIERLTMKDRVLRFFKRE